MQENGRYKFGIMVFEVSFFVGNPVAARFRLTYDIPCLCDLNMQIAHLEKPTIRKMPLCVNPSEK